MKIELEEKCLKMKFKSDISYKPKKHFRKNVNHNTKDHKPLRHFRILRH
jgi:hypothetical protein